MKKEKLFLSLLLVLTMSITTFAMPPKWNDFEKNNKDCCKFGKNFCPAQFQQCEIFMLLGLGPEIKREPKEFALKKEFNFRFIQSLSEEQKDKIKQIKDTNRKNMEQITNDIKAKFEEVDRELSKDKYNQKNIKKLTKEINLLSDKKIEAKISERQQIRDILEAKQFKNMISEPSKYDILAQRLELTQEQQNKVENLFETNRKTLDSIKKDLADKNLALENEFNKKEANFDTINSLTNEIAELSKNKFQIIMDTKAELKKILNNEQFNKIIKGQKEHQPIPVPKPIKPIPEEK